MSVDQEKPQFPPVEAHPEPPLSHGPLLDRLNELQGPPITRRKAAALTLAGLAGIAATAYGANRHINGSSTEAHASGEEAEVFIPQPILASLDTESNQLKISDVAEYWQPSFKYTQVDPNDPSKGLQDPRWREFTTDKEFQKKDNKYVTADPNNMPDGSRLKLILTGRDNQFGFIENIPTSISDPNDPEGRLFLWGVLVDPEGNPIDPTGEPAEGKVYATSPIFFDLDHKLED